MTPNKWHLIDDVEYLLRENNVDPAVIARACEINEGLKTQISKRDDHVANVAGLIFLWGVISAGIFFCWQMSVLLVLLSIYAAFHPRAY